jgi:ATP-dependent DNA helicase PIF1
LLPQSQDKDLTSKPPLILGHEMTYALDQLEHSQKHIFISGRAGTGKSTLLQLFRSTSHKRIAVVAPTGVAALNVKGQTIHSFFKFAPRLLSFADIHKAKNTKLYKNLEILIIDEISMVRADMMDNMDYFLKINREDGRPFGGVRVIVFGDLFQLPPVVAGDFERQYLAERYKTPYFFSSRAYKSVMNEMETIELNTVYRQNEKRFINLLDQIRLKQIDWDELEDLNERVVPDEDVMKGSITLTTRNKVVHEINNDRLAELETEPINFPAIIRGRFDPRIYPTDSVLTLKRGAQVMTLKNDPQRRYVNGSIGEIIDIDIDKITIEILNEQEEAIRIDLEKESWEMIKYKWDPAKRLVEADVIGSFEQYPLKLAWAMTIHKSQGKTFDRVYIDMAGGAFEFGQTYVALSRCRTLQGVQLKRPLTHGDILVDNRIVDFYNYWR